MWCCPDAEADEGHEQLASATSGNASIRRFANVGTIEVAIPNAGRTMM